ncbi:P27 family phage terminase small subunit [Roseovarius pelagicus]|uniref:P27 family phage terminase small subunit n=2 Tax=Roseovarius pelagicus TaxID=2980108 RepID=A0ABY6DJT7_9RHOB|nr:P27 family phage terminase small subunit [Roseovarius pelagicus]
MCLVANLVPHARNARTHNQAQVAKIAGSIREFGFNNPVLVDAESGIIAGHGRVLKTPSDYVQQSPWLSVANKQMELIARYMDDLGLTPVTRARLDIRQNSFVDQVTIIKFAAVYTDKDGMRCERPLAFVHAQGRREKTEAETITYEPDECL